MSTCVFYLDESGDPHSFALPIKPGETATFTLAAIAFPLNNWRNMDRGFQKLKAHFFPDILMKKGNKEDIEIKGNTLTAPRSQKSRRRQDFCHATLNYIEKMNGCTFGVTFIKNASRPTPSTSLYTKGVQVLLERFNAYIDDTPEYTDGIIICDSRASSIRGSGLDAEVARSYMSYIFGNETGKTLCNLHEAPLFADSKLTAGIQLADIFAAVLYSSHNFFYARDLGGAPDYSHVQKLWPTVQKLEYKRITSNDADRVFGYRVINHNK